MLAQKQPLIQRVRNSSLVELAGIRVCVCVFILNAVLKLIKSAIVDKATLVMYIVLFLAAVFFDFSPVLSVIVAGVLGNLLAKWGVRGNDLSSSVLGVF